MARTSYSCSTLCSWRKEPAILEAGKDVLWVVDGFGHPSKDLGSLLADGHISSLGACDFLYSSFPQHLFATSLDTAFQQLLHHDASTPRLLAQSSVLHTVLHRFYLCQS